MKKRIVSLLLMLAMVIVMVPAVASATEPDTVYISISDDAQYITDLNGDPMAYVAVTLEELATVDLDTYGLSDYWYDADGDGNYELTALHLYIYVHENILGRDFSEVGISGSAGSIYFYANLFGFSDENLRYDYNGAYPAVDGWGLTADQIVLSDGDYLNIAHYTSWAFWGDSITGFHYFADETGSITYEYAAMAAESCQVKLVRSYSDWMNGGVPALAEEPYFEVYYGLAYGDPVGSVTTDDYGNAIISFPTAGTWYVWANGGYGMENPYDIVSAPAFAIVTVKEDADKAAANAVMEKIDAIGTVTLDSEDAIANARSAYDALTDAQKALVTNYAVLTAAEETLAQLKQAVADQQAADEVTQKIDAIGDVTVFSGSKIDAARTAYDALTDAQKALVENYADLIAAEDVLKDLYLQAAQADHKAIYEATIQYLLELGTPGVGSVGGEWMVIDLTRAGYDCPEGYYENVVAYVLEKINDKEQLHRAKSTDNSRVILALTAAGYDVTDVGGHNLLMGLTDMDYLKKQGINGPIWALIALDTHNYEIPTNPDAADQVTREKLIAHILEKQLDDGGWALSGKVADPDMTGMAIQSLAPYYNTNADVKAAVDAALSCLSAKQHANGGFGSVDGTCSESCAQVIVALTALGIDPETDPRFVKNGISVLDAMCLFAVDGGGFAHVPGGSLNGMATEQSQYALAAYFRFKNSQTSLYNMTDVVLPGEAVAELIVEIGTVSLESEAAITAARAAYDALSDYQKTLVTNYTTLTDAEAALAQLKECKHVNTTLKNAEEATCTEAGYSGDTYCNDCDTVVSTGRTIPAQGHDWLDASCTSPMTCDVCYATKGDALGHEWRDADCTSPKTCDVCGDIEGSALGHDWDEGVVTKEPTEDTDGEITFTCSVCKDTTSKTIAALGHTHAYAAAVIEPTCTEDGYTTYTCACGDTYVDNKVAALGHTWLDASCTAAKTCTVCAAVEGEALGHTYQDGICTVCGETDPNHKTAEGSVSVYVTIADKANVVMLQQTVIVVDVNHNGIFDMDDALYAAHEVSFEGGAAAGYASEYTQYGLSLAMLWGDTSYGYGYWRNNASCWSLEDAVAEGDHLVAFVYADIGGWSDAYSKFDAFHYTADTAQDLVVKLEKAGYDENWNTVFSAHAGATITVYDNNGKALSSGYTVTDNGDGSYAIRITAAGSYYMVATDSDPLTVPAVCQVVVTHVDQAPPTGDHSMILLAVAAMSVSMLAVLCIGKKKAI